MKTVKITSGSRTISDKTRLLEGIECASGLMFGRGDVLLKLREESISYSSIHTFFCKPLLVAWFDKNMRIVDIKKTKPFRFYTPKKRAKYVFETTDLKKKLKIGEKLSMHT